MSIFDDVSIELNCPQCGCLTDEFKEGYCLLCCEENQQTLDFHNASFDRWERLSDKEKTIEIHDSMR